jgi:hypothetical protein
MMLRKYAVGKSSLRWKRRGTAKTHYLRCEHFYVALARGGCRAKFFEEEDFRDARRDAIRFGGYSICVERADGKRDAVSTDQVERLSDWRVSVEIDAKSFCALKKRFLELAVTQTAAKLEREFRGVPFEPYPAVQHQMAELLWMVNEARKIAGLDAVRREAIRRKRIWVNPFGVSDVMRAA